MFLINEIFTKKDFLEIILKEDIPIKSPALCSKSDLKEFLECYIVDRKKQNKYKFLVYKDTNILSSKEKEKKMIITKKISSWLSNGFDFERSYYNDIDEIILDAQEIKNYTQYPSINKAMVNLNVFLGNHNYEKIFYENLYDIKHEIKKLKFTNYLTPIKCFLLCF